MNEKNILHPIPKGKMLQFKKKNPAGVLYQK